MPNPVFKVCGMKYADNIQAVLQTAKPDWMGFIFFEKSPRHISPIHYQSIAQINGIKKVGVFVNESLETIQKIARDCKLDMIQLHGEESPAFCENVRSFFPVIKAISIKKKEDLNKALQYEPFIDFLLFDTKKKGMRGGTGEKFDWEILRYYTGKTPFLLSGGISLADVVALQAFHHDLCVGYDVNSGFEIEPALKHTEDLAKFIEKIKE